MFFSSDFKRNLIFAGISMEKISKKFNELEKKGKHIIDILIILKYVY